MALRRMFSLEVVNTDVFLDLPLTAQCLYFHLGMRADDDGFVASPKRITAMIGCTQEDLQQLVDAKLLLQFPGGVCVIRHWKVNNYLQKDRYKETIYLEEKSKLRLEDTGVYELDTTGIQPVSILDTQDRVGKERSEKDRRENETAADAATHAGRVKRISRSRYGWIRLSDEEYHSLLNDLGQAEVERCITYVDESAQATGNRNKWRDWNLVLRRCHRDRWGMGKQQPMTAAAQYDDEDSFL